MAMLNNQKVIKVVLWGIHEYFLCVMNIDRRGGSDPLVFLLKKEVPQYG